MRTLLAISFLAMLLWHSPQSSAQPYSQVIVFGDSNVDAGYYKMLSSPGGGTTFNSLWPSAVAHGAGAPTTSPGMVYPGYLAAYFGLTANPSNATGGGTNYATSGAKNVMPNTAANGGFTAAIPTHNQMSNYLSAHGGVADSQALYVIHSGDNDVTYAAGDSGTGPFPSDPNSYVIEAAEDLGGDILILKNSGAQHIIVAGLAYDYPTGGSADAINRRALKLLYTNTLFQNLIQIGVPYVQANINSVRLKISANPSNYGFTSIGTGAGQMACSHRDVVLTRRAMEALAIDYMVVFPTPMLFLGMHPQPEMEAWLGRAYNRWLAERLLAADDRIKSLIYLPFNTPEEAERTVEEFDDVPGVIGYCITSTRYKPVHHNHYMRLYAMIEERGKPLAFHAGYHWQDPSLATINRFLGMHALGFVWSNMVHATNWVLNGIPERFPKLKPIWVESGIAWVPFLMQRLDDQYLMRPSEAPQLKRLPSEYLRDNCWYTTQPMETTNRKALEVTLEMINAQSQLLFASDWPHFDFDLPGEIIDLPFLSEQAKRNILGLNAARIFNLEPKIRKSL